MASKPNKLQRWLDVIACLASRRFPIDREELWRAVPAYRVGLDGEKKESVRRMFERDKKELIEFGIPIQTVEMTVDGVEQPAGYVLGDAFHLPYLRLVEELRRSESDAAPAARSRSGDTFDITEREAAAALDGLRELATLPAFPLASSARSAFRKLAFDLDSVAEGTSPIAYAVDPETEAAAEHLPALSDAVRRRKRIDFRYWSITTDEEEDRAVHPLGLLFQHGRWYLVGHDLDRDAPRMYRLGRISALEVNGARPGTPDFEPDPDFSLDAYAGRNAWELGAEDAEPMEVVVRFAFPRSLWAERNGHGELLEEDASGTQRRRFAVHRPDPFLRWILSLAGDATVESPDDFRRDFLALSRRVAELHGEGDAA